MNRLVVSEFRKIFTTKLWWGLLIPVGCIALFAGFTGAWFADLGAAAEGSGTLRLPTVALTVPYSIQQTTVFAVVLGMIGGAGEFRHKTITTTYLTGSSRGAVLAAKAVAYGAIGLLYGLVTALLCSAGALVRSGADPFPSAGESLAIIAVGCLATMAWAVLGVGIGTLISNQVGVLIGVLIYVLLIEGVAGFILRLDQIELDALARLLPRAASAALISDYGIDAFIGHLDADAEEARPVLQSMVGSSGQLSWWGGGLVFAAYTAAFAAAGWLVGRRRDIT